MFRVRCGFNLSVDFQPRISTTGDRTHMTDWMDDLVKKTKDKFDAQRIADEKAVQDRKIKVELGQQYWNRIKAWLRDNSKTFNQRIASNYLNVSESIPSMYHIECAPTHKSASIEYNETTQVVSWTITDRKTSAAQHQSMQLVLIGDTQIAAQHEDITADAEEVGQKILEQVLT